MTGLGEAAGTTVAGVGEAAGTTVAGVGEAVWSVHTPSTELVPGSQVVAQAASALVVPFITEMWAPHVGAEWAVHGVLSLLEE